VTKIAILGAGSWGTALAIIFSRSERKHDISLWAHDAALAASLRRTRENGAYLPRHSLPANVSVTNNVKEAISGATIVIGAMAIAAARKAVDAAMAKRFSDRILI